MVGYRCLLHFPPHEGCRRNVRALADVMTHEVYVLGILRPDACALGSRGAPAVRRLDDACRADTSERAPRLAPAGKQSGGYDGGG